MKRLRFYDLTGKTFSNWKVLKRAPNRYHRTMWSCRCVCGTKRDVSATTLRDGTSRSCGCLQRPPNTTQVIDLTGRQFGKLLVVERASSRAGSNYAWWTVHCSCGKRYDVSGAHLRAGQRSCGCTKPKRSIHGHTAIDPRFPDRDRHSPTYRTWQAMISRCTRSSCSQWPRYGGRGINVCKRWRKFANFLTDMGERPLGKTLDRYPNRDGGYKPSNCRWATLQEQAQNRDTPDQLRLKIQKLERHVLRLRKQVARLKGSP
jgi:hypothetical protein